MTMDFPLSHDRSSSASGTTVVLPAPGGALSTTARCDDSAACNSGKLASIGNPEIERVILVNAPADQFLQQRIFRGGGCRPRHIWHRVPDVFENHEETLCLDASAACFFGRGAQKTMLLVRVITAFDGLGLRDSDGLDCFWFERGRGRRSIEGHHTGNSQN